MSIGSWDPTLASQTETLSLDTELLGRLVRYSREEQLDQLEGVMSEADKQNLAHLMKIDHSLWRSNTETLEADTIVHLIRFLAVAENLPGWEAGASSPVIPLAKVLRERGARLDKAQLLWLREVSENRYLPYGPL